MHDYGRARELLSDKLYDVHLMHIEEGRISVLEEMRNRGHALGVTAAAPTTRIFCLRLLDATLQERGGLQALAAILDWLTDGTSAANEFGAMVDALVPGTFLKLKERIAFIQDMSPYVVHRLELYYQRATGEVSPRTYADLDELVAQLEQLPERPPPHPLVRLAESIAQNAEVAGAAETARGWSDRFAELIDAATRSADRWDGERESLARLRQQGINLTAARIGRSILILQLNPEGMRPDHYLFSAWLYRNGGATFEQIVGGDSPASLQEIRKIVTDLSTTVIRLINQGGERSPDLTVEFFLPRRLLCEPVEDWQFGRGPYMKLGIQFPVVVRDLERNQDGAVQIACLQKWASLTTMNGSPQAGLSRWVKCSDPPYQPGQIYAVLRSPGCVSLGLTFQPDGTHVFELEEALDAGVPVAVWPHNCADPSGATMHIGGRAFRTMLMRNLTDHQVKDLPDIVLQLRRHNASMQRPSVGMTLLWDDPTHIPAPSGFHFDMPTPARGSNE